MHAKESSFSIRNLRHIVDSSVGGRGDDSSRVRPKELEIPKCEGSLSSGLCSRTGEKSTDWNMSHIDRGPA